jgi:hypothetical protein
MQTVALSEPAPMDKIAPPPPPGQPYGNAAYKKADIAKEEAQTSSVLAPLDGSQPQQTNVFVPNYATQGRKILREADVKTKVQNTERATYQVEQLARRWHGYVMANQFDNRVMKSENVQISTDSLLEIQQIQAVNSMTVRVPNAELDTFLAELSRIYVHLDNRTVHVTDMTSTFLTNYLKAKQREQSAARLAQATDEKGKRLSDITQAEQSRLQMTDAAVEQQVENLETDYKIAFSTVRIELYQEPIVTKTMQACVPPTTATFGFRCQQALANGWAFLGNVFVLLLNLWVLIVVGVLGLIWYRRGGRLPVLSR